MKISWLCIYILFNLFVFLKGYDLWLNKVNYGTFVGKVNIQKDFTITGFDKNNKPVIVNKGKYVVLDFWFSSCGACFKEFPQFENLYKKYKTRKDIMFYAVNTPMPSDKVGITSFRMIAERKYSFPVLQMTDNLEANKLAITVYPTTFLLDKNGNIIYKGDIEGLITQLEKL
ncbi:redoxin domain-containing protein [Pedobacter sp. CCM 8938]|uniref:Redoxin domain-containing protein n=2 Tax=Pedobacter fastidiosus TaxID=2765361 RepID=A0ABR7KSV6_9SPHI|nr:redoxin domain-containing protein [Pedobacter fastidiosus]